MYSTTLSGTIFGAGSYLVQIEVDMSSGLPCFAMVGSLGKEVKESGERVRIALKNRGIHLPPMHIAVNLSPADLKKEGTGFDLPIAAALLLSMGRIPKEETENTLFLGELGLNGEIKPVRGVLPIVMTAKKAGIRRFLIPEKNTREAGVIEGVEVIGISSLEQMIAYLNAPTDLKRQIIPHSSFSAEVSEEKREQLKEPDFSEIIGQESVKRAALLAASGFHNLLISGPPGGGKTMIARRLPGILPPMSLEESLEVSSIYSIAGLLDEKCSFVTKRPFLNPHHTISMQAMTGGGQVPRPGIISLAHRGVLFLDEMPEFKRQTLDLLRQPLEDKKIQIVRAAGNFTYPADFMLVGAMNPCPCGYYPDRNKCRCTPFEIHQYLSHISGPILDRMDLCVSAPKIEISQLQGNQKGISSASIRQMVMAARERQSYRYRGTNIRFNADLGAGQIETYCSLTQKEKKMVEKMFRTMDLSVRAYHRMLKVARTIADVEESEKIKEVHLAEAACCMGQGKEILENGK